MDGQSELLTENEMNELLHDDERDAGWGDEDDPGYEWTC